MKLEARADKDIPNTVGGPLFCNFRTQKSHKIRGTQNKVHPNVVEFGFHITESLGKPYSFWFVYI